MSHIYKKENKYLHGEITLEGIWWHEVYFNFVSVASNLVQPNTSNLYCMYGIIASILVKCTWYGKLRALNPLKCLQQSSFLCPATFIKYNYGLVCNDDNNYDNFSTVGSKYAHHIAEVSVIPCFRWWRKPKSLWRQCHFILCSMAGMLGMPRCWPWDWPEFMERTRLLRKLSLSIRRDRCSGWWTREEAVVRPSRRRSRGGNRWQRR